MSTAFILGNGNSRLRVDLTKLPPLGTTYGCNWLCKDFVPDCLVATDRPIADSIQQSGYAQKYRFHTRKPIVELGGKHLNNQFKGYSSGPNAAALACIDGHSDIYLIGMDFGTTNGMFNNVYVDREFYKKQLDPPTFPGNWVNQIIELATEHYPNRQFYRVEGVESATHKQLGKMNNMKIISMESFIEMVNTARGPL